VAVLGDTALDQLDVIRAIAEHPVEGKPSDPAAHDQFRSAIRPSGASGRRRL
jgi:hypothetical protein